MQRVPPTRTAPCATRQPQKPAVGAVLAAALGSRANHGWTPFVEVLRLFWTPQGKHNENTSFKDEIVRHFVGGGKWLELNERQLSISHAVVPARNRA